MDIGGNSGHVIQTEPHDQLGHCNQWKFWSRDTDVTNILSFISIKNVKKKNHNRSKFEIF